MGANDRAEELLCKVCDRQLCNYPCCNKIHQMMEILAEAQLEIAEGIKENILSLYGKQFPCVDITISALRNEAGR